MRGSTDVRPPRRRWRALGLLMAVAIAVTACDGEAPPDATDPQPVDIGADAYTTVILQFMSPSLEPDARPVVYVVPVSGDALALETQVSVIDALADSYDVRFVDEPDAAVDEGASDDPPRDEGTLIGLGRISALPPHNVRVELYRGRDRVSGHLLTLRKDGEEWVVIDSETVAPEVLVGEG